MPSVETRLCLVDVHFSYPDQHVLKGLSFKVEAGEIVGFLGVNGCGKTTTFRLATGLFRPNAGELRLAGVDPHRSKAWCTQVGVVFSGAGHYQRLSVRRNLTFFANLYGVSIDLDAHMAAYGLEVMAGRAVSKLSTGYRQRLSLARATLHQPNLLLLDEPSDGLDPQATDDLHAFLRAFVASGGSVLFTTHRIEEVEALCDRVVLLAKGVAAFDGPPSELGDQEGSLRASLLALGRRERGICAS